MLLCERTLFFYRPGSCISRAGSAGGWFRDGKLKIFGFISAMELLWFEFIGLRMVGVVMHMFDSVEIQDMRRSSAKE